MTRHEKNLSRNMKTTDYSLAEIDDYIAVRKLVTRKEMRLAHEYEKTLEWRHMEKLHLLREDLNKDTDRKYYENNNLMAIGITGCIPGKAIRMNSNRHNRANIIYDDDKLPCVVNGIEIPKHLRRTLNLILSHGKNRQVSINLIMCDNSSKYTAAEVLYYKNRRTLMAIFGVTVKSEFSK